MSTQPGFDSPSATAAAQVFRYLRALNDLRNKPVADIGKQHWSLPFADLPVHPTIESMKIEQFVDDEQSDRDSAADNTDARSSDQDDSFVLRVRRPEHTEPPHPPDIVSEWLADGWPQRATYESIAWHRVSSAVA